MRKWQLILVVFYVKVFRNSPFDEFAEKDVPAVICVDDVEFCK